MKFINESLVAERSQIDEIKDKLDIVDLAQEYLRTPFKRSGRNVFTVCPFHNEKTPSFSLNSELGIFKCFGCGESGDVIEFIQKYEGIDFPQALEIAANKAGIKLEKNVSPKDKKLSEERKRLLEANSLTAEIYNYLLLKHDSGNDARSYCKQRKLSSKDAKAFNLGFAPNSFEVLKNKLKAKGFKESELIKWGLLVSKNGRVYDKFRNRLIFPIINHRGETVGFSGRTLDKDGIPKYLNSPETLVYKKSEILYGLFQAKNDIRKRNFAIIAEGNFEPVSSARIGIPNVVVPMGTSLTTDQLKLIKRYTDNIYFAFDTDTAGKAALIRSIKLATPLDFNLRSINLGNHQDPDDMIRKDPKKWIAAVDNNVDTIEFLFHKFAEEEDVNSAAGKSNLMKKAKDILSLVTDPLKLDHYKKILADVLGVRSNIVEGYFSDKFETTEQGNYIEATFRDESITQKEYLLSLMLNYPKLKLGLEGVVLGDDLEELLIKIEEENDLKTIRKNLEPRIKAVFDRICMLDSSKLKDLDKVKITFEKVKKAVLRKQYSDKLNNLRNEVKKKEGLGEDVDKILEEIEVVTEELRSLR